MKLTLREKKAATLRLALLDALVARLDERPLSDIPVRELCAEVPCSEPTFFNHFAGKHDLLVFFIQLWSLEMAWRVQNELATGDPLVAIEEIFVVTARRSAEHPGVMAEILAFQARGADLQPPRPLSTAEKVLAHPDREGIADLEGVGIEGVVPPLLRAAVDRGLLPESTDLPAAFFAVAAIFFGTPAVARQSDLALMEPMYRQQLHWLWAALRTPAG